MLKLDKNTWDDIKEVLSEINEYYKEISSLRDILESMVAGSTLSQHKAELRDEYPDGVSDYLFHLDINDLKALIARREEEINKRKICLMDPYGISYTDDNYIEYD